jgi:DNA-binding transcriptional LysR family regulator
MDLERMVHFLAVIEHGGIGRAAASLNITQPALSKSLRKLEESLGQRLIDRGAFGARPTMFGRSLAERARVIVREVRNVKADFSALQNLETGHVSIGAGPSLMTDLLPRAVAKLQRRRPHARVTLREGLMDELLEELAVGALDLAIGGMPDEVSDIKLIREPLFVDPVAVVARADHPLARKEGELPLRELLAYPWIMPGGPEILRSDFAALFEGTGLTPPPPTATTNSAHCMKAVVMQGHWLSFMPASLIRIEERRGELAAIRLAAPAWTRRVDAIHRADVTLSPAARALLADLRNACKSMGLGLPAQRHGAITAGYEAGPLGG